MSTTATPAVTSTTGHVWLPFVGWLRVLAMLGVIFIHTGGIVINQEALRNTPVWALGVVLNGGSRWCVPMFVVISGALLLNERTMSGGIAHFYRRRLARLLPPLVVWQLVYLLFTVVVRHQSTSVSEVVAQVLTGRIYTAMYFFWLILGLYFVAPFVWGAVRDLSPRTWFRVGLGSVAVTCAWQTTIAWLSSQGTPATPGTQTIWTYWVPYTGLFVLGGALARRPASARDALVGAALFVVGTGVTMVQVAQNAPGWLDVASPSSYYSWFVAASALGLWLVVSWVAREGTLLARGRVGVVGERLGALTLGVFAVHLLVVYYTLRVLAPDAASGTIRLPALVELVVVTVVVSWAIAWALSKVPGLRRLV